MLVSPNSRPTLGNALAFCLMIRTVLNLSTGSKQPKTLSANRLANDIPNGTTGRVRGGMGVWGYG